MNWFPTGVRAFSQSTANQLMVIAQNDNVRNSDHATNLPVQWTTLFALTKLTDEQFDNGIKNGSINPKMQRRDVKDRILELAPSINQSLAASIIEGGMYTSTGCTADEPTLEFVGVFRLARALRSQATHAVRAAVDRIFDNPGTTLEDLNVLPS